MGPKADARSSTSPTTNAPKDAERRRKTPKDAERRRKQQETYRRRQGIPPKAKRTGLPKAHRTNWAQAYFDIWGKPPGVPVTKEEFAEREPLWNAWIAERWGDGDFR